MAFKSKYVLLTSTLGNFFDFDLNYGSVTLDGQDIKFVGSGSVDAVFLYPGISVDFTSAGGGVDKLYLSGEFSSYALSYAGSTLTLQRTVNGKLEKAVVSSGDTLVFMDGYLSSLAVLNYAKGVVTAAPTLNSAETSVQRNLPGSLGASAKAVALDSAGVTFAQMNPGVSLKVVGGSGVDVVYVKAGSEVDASSLGGSVDAIYFTGKWADYSKSLAGSSVVFQRTVNGILEKVTFAAGDKAFFADGSATTVNIKSYVSSNASGLPAAWSGSDITPGLNNAPTGSVTISGGAGTSSAPKQGDQLSVSNTLADADGIGTITYQWKAAGVAISGANGSTFTVTEAQVGKAITVAANYTDGKGFDETPTSAATPLVLNINEVPVGSVTISGTATQGQTLAAANTISDADGIPVSGAAGALGYQWQADGVDIVGATNSTLLLGQSLVGKSISVVASYTDIHGGTVERVSSTSTAAVLNTEDEATGTLALSGAAVDGGVLTASIQNLVDLDGMVQITGYQWQSSVNGSTDWSDISGATTANYLVAAGASKDPGKFVRVLVTTTDSTGATSIFVSDPSTAISHVNHSPTAALAFAGALESGKTLTVADAIIDADGKTGTVTYSWYANGIDSPIGTGASLALTDAQIGKSITLKATYVDDFGYAETVSSAASSSVVPPSTVNTNVLASGVSSYTATTAHDVYEIDATQLIISNISGFAVGDTLLIKNATAQQEIAVADYVYGNFDTEIVIGNATLHLSNLDTDLFAPNEAGFKGHFGSGSVAYGSIVQVPKVSSITIAVSGATNGMLNTGDVVTATVSMSAAVTPTLPTLALKIGAQTVNATYSAVQSAATTLVFTYTIAAAQSGALSFAANSLGGTIVAASGGAAASLDHSAVATSYVVDTSVPAVPVVTVGEGVSGGVTSAEAMAGTGVVTIRGEEGAALAISFADGTHTVSKNLVGTGADLAVFLTSNELATLNQGLISVSVSSTDAAGNSSVATSSFTLDTISPANAPTVTSSSATTNARPTISGDSAEAGSIVSVYDGALLLGTAVADGSGHFSFSPTADLEQGAHAIKVKSTDGAGNSSVLSNAASLFVDSVSPLAWIIDAQLNTPGNAIVRSSELGTAYLVKDTVSVSNLSSITNAADSLWNSVSITSANTDTNLSVSGLAAGDYYLYTADAAGNLSAVSTSHYVLG